MGGHATVIGVIVPPSLHHGQRKRFFPLNLLPPAADFAQRVGREDVYLFLAELRFAALDFRLEEASVRELADAIWSEMLTTYPLPLGYFSDCPSTLDLLDWCGQPNHGLSRLAAER